MIYSGNDYEKSQDFVVDDSSIFQSQFRQVNSKFSPTMMNDFWFLSKLRRLD